MNAVRRRNPFTRSILGSTAVLGLALWATPSHAVQEASHLAGHDGLELAHPTKSVRHQRVLEWFKTPRPARVGWARVKAELGPKTHAVWDPVTEVPSRIWGQGVDVPGSVASPSAAASFARGFLARHIGLLAPGAAPGDFVLVTNDLDHGMRTLGFVQHASGVPVLGGQVSFRFKNDRLFMIGSEGLPHAVASTTSAKVSDATVRAAAESWLLTDVASVASSGKVEGPFVLPLVSHTIDFRTVLRVTVDTQPIGKWTVYVDATSGDVVAREQTLRFATGTVLYNAPVRRPGATRQDYPAAYASLSVNGSTETSDAQGVVSWPSGSATIGTTVSGDFINVNNQGGGDVTGSLNLADGGTAVWSLAQDEFNDAQLSVFVHGNLVKEYARVFAADLPYLDELLPANVNINQSCNAFYDGGSINFFRQANGCGNTGRLADVVYHEFGHALHDNGILEGVGAFEGGASEGLSDFLAATITGDPGMGRGFFNSDEPLRHIDPPNFEHKWPDDIGEVHYTGLIIAGALWDMRKELVTNYGEGEGVAVANHIFYQAMRRAVDIPTMYFEALAADDDDGDLTNGTPHVCEINAGFAPHGLREVTALGSKLSVQPPHLDGYLLSLAISGLFYTCPGDDENTAEVEWRLRSDPSMGGTVPMSLGETGFEATIPAQPDGSVVQYRVTVSFADGRAGGLPHQRGRPLLRALRGTRRGPSTAPTSRPIRRSTVGCMACSAVR